MEDTHAARHRHYVLENKCSCYDMYILVMPFNKFRLKLFDFEKLKKEIVKL